MVHVHVGSIPHFGSGCSFKRQCVFVRLMRWRGSHKQPGGRSAEPRLTSDTGFGSCSTSGPDLAIVSGSARRRSSAKGQGRRAASRSASGVCRCSLQQVWHDFLYLMRHECKNERVHVLWQRYKRRPPS